LDGCSGDEVCPIADELGVEAEDGAERALNLRSRIVVGLQAAHRCLNERVECGNIVFGGEADGEGRGHSGFRLHHSSADDFESTFVGTEVEYVLVADLLQALLGFLAAQSGAAMKKDDAILVLDLLG
jgi:hypothetical protein